MRYYDKVNKTEFLLRDGKRASADIIELPSDNVFWSPLPKGHRLVFTDDIPSATELVPVDTRARDVNKLQVVRNTALKANEVVLDTYTFQTRPSDLANFTLEISALAPLELTPWVLKDNRVAQVTREQLEQVLVTGISQGRAIWTKYTTALEAL